MSTSEKRELSDAYQKFMMAATRVHNFECSTGLPYSENPEYKRLEKILIEMSRSKYKEKKKS